MAPNPMKMNTKQSANSSTTSIAASAAASSQEILVRETLRISANLASAPLLQTPSSLTMICCEEIDGRRWKYVAETDASGHFKKNSFRPLSLQSPQAPLDVSSFLFSLSLSHKPSFLDSFYSFFHHHDAGTSRFR